MTDADIDSTSQAHIYDALQRATSFSKKRNGGNCAVSNLEINSLDVIIHDNRKLQKIIEHSKRKQIMCINKERIYRPKVLQKFSSSQVLSEKLPKSVWHSNRKTRESFVTLDEGINLEPAVVSPFHYKTKQQQLAQPFRKQRSPITDATASNFFLPKIRHRRCIRASQQIACNQKKSIKKINITLPSINDDNYFEFEKNSKSSSSDFSENEASFCQIVDNILRETSDTLQLPREKLNLSQLYRVFADDTVQSSRDEITKHKKNQAHKAIRRFYKLQEIMVNPVLIIHLPKPELSLGRINNLRVLPKLLLR